MIDVCKACGYEYEEGMRDGGWVTIKGEAEFVPLNLTATVSTEWDGDRPVHIKACPECGTLSVNTYDLPTLTNS